MNAKQLQSFLVDEIQVEDLVLARAQLTALDVGYQDLGIETPEWVTDKLAQVNREVVNRNRDELERRLKAAEARRAGLATAEEKRQSLDAEIKGLKEKLGK